MEHTSVENFAGMKIAGYEIIHELGRGNNGVVCLARQEIMDREVACKILLPELAREPGYVDSFLKEAIPHTFYLSKSIVFLCSLSHSSTGFVFFNQN